jgi:hypothetical protein
MGSYAQVSSNVDELIRREIAGPPFPKSVFTTAEINFCDAPSISHKNWDAVFDSMEAVTSLGTYDHQKGGHILFPDDDEMVEMPRGTTVLFPAGTKSYNFAAVGEQSSGICFVSSVARGCCIGSRRVGVPINSLTMRCRRRTRMPGTRCVATAGRLA